jgi:hypothetical protein
MVETDDLKTNLKVFCKMVKGLRAMEVASKFSLLFEYIHRYLVTAAFRAYLDSLELVSDASDIGPDSLAYPLFPGHFEPCY